jgi:sulfur-oxidizing protein SoxY
MARLTPPPEVSRRGFMGLAVAALGLGPAGAQARPAAPGEALAGVPALTPFEREHLPLLTLPALTANGRKVPLVVEMAHPMTAEHHVTRVEVVNPRDPVASKGVFHLTPGSGGVYLAWQAQFGEGVSEVTVAADCNRHGRFTASRVVDVSPAGGGCGDTPAAARRTDGEDVRAPVLRIAELVERGRVLRDEVLHVQVKLRHPNRATGAIPLRLETLEVDYAGERVGRFEMTGALAEDPFITFTVRASRDGLLVARLANSRGERFEASHEVHLA